MEHREHNDYLFWWLVPALIAVGFFFAWSNHFDNAFHDRDFPRIVDNQALHDGSSFAAFLTRPLTSSAWPEYVEYRPLLTATYAYDYPADGPAEPHAFHVDGFVWFVVLICWVYILFRFIPGGNHLSAGFGTALFALHPAVADTVNYVSQRGIVMGALGIVAALAIWIVWPRRLPEKLWVNTQRSTQDWQEDVLRKRVHRNNALYQRLIHLPLGVYLIPLVVGLLADPAAALFVPLLGIYIGVFEREGRYRRLIPSALLCTAWVALATALTWRYRTGIPIPDLSNAAPYLYHFFVPWTLSPIPAPLSFNWMGLAALIPLTAVAVICGRHNRWQPVSFGLWWFLAALLVNEGMFLPFIGLALACTRAVEILVPRAAALAVALIVLIAAGTGTLERNKIWATDEDLWKTAAARNPSDGRAAIQAATNVHDLRQAGHLAAGSAVLETDLALAFDRLGEDGDAEEHFERAVAADPGYSRAYSIWSRWSERRQKYDDALKLADTAVRLQPAEMDAEHTLLEVRSQRSEWAAVKDLAMRVLAIRPGDSVAEHSLILAQSTLDEVERTAAAVKEQPAAAQFLKLSVLYFQNKRYQEAIEAGQNALRLDGSLGEAWADIAAANHELGKDDDAIAAFREAMRLNPNLPAARSNLDYLLARKASARP